MLNFDHLLHPLTRYQGAGVPLHFDFIYDQIKEARREDDHRLTQGVWKTQPKIADWPLVIELCEDILVSQSKDLQVVGWLLEAWVMRYHFTGMQQGLLFLKDFCQAFWSVLYPNAMSIHIDDGLINEYDIDHPELFENLSINNDVDAEIIAERRSHILRWIDKMFAQRMLFIEIVPAHDDINIPALNLAVWIDAIDEDRRLRRQQAVSFSSQDKETSSHQLSLCRTALSLASIDHLQKLTDELRTILSLIARIKHDFFHYDITKMIPFYDTENRLLELIGILEIDLKKRVPKESAQATSPASLDPAAPSHSKHNPSLNLPSPPPTTIPHLENPSHDVALISERQDAYDALKQIGDFLKEIDPHSPAPEILNLLISWQNKTLLQIVNDINTGSSDAHMLIRLLAHHVTSDTTV